MEDPHDDTEPTDVIRRERFSGGPARDFLSSLAADERLFKADLEIDRAHVVMLTEQEIISPADASAILSALATIENAGHDELPESEDVHEAIETAVIQQIGERGGRMHTARSRNDEIAACIRYRLREDLLTLFEKLLDLRAVLTDVADEHKSTVMPGFTHLQPAQPTTVAHFLLSYEQAINRDSARILDAYDRVNQSPLGAAAFAGTPFPIDRTRTAELLGFDGIIQNSMDAASSRDFLLESTAVVSTLATTLTGLAEDIVIFSNKGYIELSDAYSSTSSIMPQKKNPDSMELVRGSIGEATGSLNAVLSILKGLPRAYNRDLQQAHPHSFDAVDAVTEAVTVTTGAIATLEWQQNTLRTEASRGFSTATGIADQLAMAGVPFRTAHEIVARAAESLDPEIQSTDEIYSAVETSVIEILDEPLETVVDPDSILNAIDPETSVAARNSMGGPAPDAVEAALSQRSQEYAADETAGNSRREHLRQAQESLREVIQAYA